MSEISSYEAQVKKMQGLCEEHNLVYRFRKENYPMTFTIKPSHRMDAQLSMMENAEDEGYISPAASMTWIFNDGVLETKVRGGTFTISKAVRTKIENILVKMIAFWQQYFFRCIIENRMLPERRRPKTAIILRRPNWLTDCFQASNGTRSKPFWSPPLGKGTLFWPLPKSLRPTLRIAAGSAN